MLQLLVAACLAIGDGGAGDELGAQNPYEEAPAEAADAGLPPEPITSDKPVEPALTPPPAPPAVETEKRDSRPEFVKGELSVYLGSDRLTVKNTRIGVSAGVDRFEDAYYALIEPMVDLRLFDAKLGIGLGVPLRVEIVNFANNPSTHQPFLFERAGRLRVEDYDTFHDFGRILKYVTYGRKEDQIYVSAGQRYASSIGHGAITRRYSPSINIDYPRASAQVDMYNDYGGFELMTNDLLEWNQLSGLAFFKPFSFFKPQSLLLKTLSVGVTGGLDWRAPFTVSSDASQSRVAADGRPLVTSFKPAGLIGFDAEMKVVKTENVDLKPYVDYSMLLGGDGGFTAGLLGRFNVQAKDVTHAFRLVMEARFLGNRYAPSYFDTFYEVDRFAYLNKDFRVDQTVGAGQYIPKQRFLLENGLGDRFGYYVEGSWGVRNAIGLTLAVEGTSASPAVNFVAHLEVPVLSFVQIFGSYYLRGVESWTELGTPNGNKVIGLFGDKSIAFAGARLRILPFLFLNGRVYKTFRVNADLGRFDNQFGFAVDLEIGYEFRKAEAAPPPREEAPTPAQGSAMGTSSMR